MSLADNLVSGEVPSSTDLDSECCADDLPERDLWDCGLDPFSETEALDSECCADDVLEPDLSDWGLEPFPETEAALEVDLPDATELLDSGLWDCGCDLVADDMRDTDMLDACIKSWQTELCAENNDAADAGLSIAAISVFGKPSATS